MEATWNKVGPRTYALKVGSRELARVKEIPVGRKWEWSAGTYGGVCAGKNPMTAAKTSCILRVRSMLKVNDEFELVKECFSYGQSVRTVE